MLSEQNSRSNQALCSKKLAARLQVCTLQTMDHTNFHLSFKSGPSSLARLSDQIELHESDRSYIHFGHLL